MNKIYKNIKYNLLYYLIYIAFIIEVGINLRSKYLWQDESFTFHMTQHNFINIIHLTAQDVHPFLYYFLAKIFTYNIQNTFTKIFILRLISILPYLIILIIGHTYIKNNFSKLISEIFMFCIISMPLLIDSIGQIRMYGWATLFVTITYLSLISIYKKNNLKTAFIISIFSLLSAYTHYYALITVTILYLSFLILFIISKKSTKYLIFSIIFNILLYLPWLSILLKQTQRTSNNFWTPKINIKDIIHITIGDISPIRHFSVFYVLPIILLILLSILLINKNINHINIIGLITPFILIIIGYVISKIIGHCVILDRYLTPSLSIFWLSISIIINNLNNKYKIIHYLLIFIILTTGIISYVYSNIHENKNTNQFNITLQSFHKIPKNSAIIYDNSVIMYISSGYLNDNFLLSNLNKGYSNFTLYKKVFNNINRNKKINISKHYKNIYYLKSNRLNKYKINDKKQIGRIILPNEGIMNLYKIK